LVKVKLLKGNRPEDAITTHANVVKAIVRSLQVLGCIVIICDSSGSALSFKAFTILNGIGYMKEF